MGVDTKGYLRKDISAREIYDVICEKYDMNAEYDIDNSGWNNEETGFIHFKVPNGDSRGLFYCVTNDREDLFEGSHVGLVLGYSDYTPEIMTELLKEFGGYLIEDDCSDNDPLYIEEGSNIRFTDYIVTRGRLVDNLDRNMSEKDKIRMAIQIMNNRENILEILGSY